MSRAPPRFSRRQVTKRKFNILDSPNVLQNVQADKNVSPQPRDTKQKVKVSTKNSKIYKQNDEIETESESGTRESKSSTRDRQYLSTRSRGKKASSPLALLKEQKENEATKDPDLDDMRSDKNDPSPQKQQKLGLAEDTPPPGDVSVSFLASTPKPGRPQLSRRRPMSPVREALVMPLSSQDLAREETVEDFSENHVIKQQKMNTPQKHKTGSLHSEAKDYESPRKRSPQKQSPRKQSPLKRSPQKQAPGGSINEKIVSLNRTRVEKKRYNSGIHDKFSKSDTSNKEISLSRTRVANEPASEQSNKLVRTRSGAKKQKVSVPVRDVPVTSSREQQDSLRDNESEGTRVSDVPQTNRTVSTKSVEVKGGTKSRGNSKSVNKSKLVHTATLGANSSSETRESGRNVSNTRNMKNITSDESDVTVKDSNSRVSLSGHRRKSAINRKLQTLSRTSEVADTSAANVSAVTDQTMMVWETESQKRTRSDLIDLDVVLNTVTETLAARMDVYDTDEEQSAAHVLEKYLTHDITHMIQGVQTVMELQSKIKKCGQSVKQKQKSLMALQKERIEMEEKCQPLKKVQEENENLIAINQFLKDLGKIIDKC